MVFVHGGFQDYRLWISHLPALGSRYRVIAYSRRNHFPNTTNPEGAADADAEQHAADLALLIRRLHLRRVHIVAHSAGAHAALFLAARYPQFVRSLVLVEPPARGLIDGSDAQNAAAAFQARFALALDALKRGDTAGGTRLFADAVGGTGTFDRRTQVQRAMMFDNVLAHVAEARWRGPRPNFTCAMASRIQVPVLLVTGTRSPDYFHYIANRLSECLPNDRRIAIEASHSVPAENPEAFDRAVTAFLAGIR